MLMLRCIGGSRDGELIAIFENDRSISLPRPMTISSTAPAASAVETAENPPMEIYTVRTIHGVGEGDAVVTVQYLAPSHMTDGEVIRHLFSNASAAWRVPPPPRQKPKRKARNRPTAPPAPPAAPTP